MLQSAMPDALKAHVVTKQPPSNRWRRRAGGQNDRLHVAPASERKEAGLVSQKRSNVRWLPCIPLAVATNHSTSAAGNKPQPAAAAPLCTHKGLRRLEPCTAPPADCWDLVPRAGRCGAEAGMREEKGSTRTGAWSKQNVVLAGCSLRTAQFPTSLCTLRLKLLSLTGLCWW